MEVFRTVNECRAALKQARSQGRRIAFVPTMGYLHRGHLELVRIGRAEADLVIASIFVNPTQFNDPRDLEAYPVDIEGDLSKLESAVTWGVFIPSVDQIYPKGVQTTVRPGDLAERFEGAFRPGHFEGVATVVTVLFNIVSPDLAIFGEKDFQQLQVIRRLVKDFSLDIEIVAAPTVREADGLAMSSRNARLKGGARERATRIYSALRDLKNNFGRGITDPAKLVDDVMSPIRDAGIECEYLSIVERETLMKVTKAASGNRVLFAGKVDGVRLIDNIEL